MLAPEWRTNGSVIGGLVLPLNAIYDDILSG